MPASIQFNSLLVPIDFSQSAAEVWRWASQLVDGEEPSLIALHVLDQELIGTMVANGFGTLQEIEHRWRSQAETELEQLVADVVAGVEVTRIVCVGVPFLEIVRKANEFAVDAIVMGRTGAGQPVDQLLFGSTAERVLRTSSRPVIVLPQANG